MKVKYREIQKGEVEKVCSSVLDCFNEFIAPEYSEEGINEFAKYVTPKTTQDRLTNNHFIILALDNDQVIGIIEVRDFIHISLFFVKGAYQKIGIGKKLHELAISKCKAARPDITTIDVNSSPYAVPIYEKLGFTRVNEEQVVNGIKFTPMIFKIK